MFNSKSSKRKCKVCCTAGNNCKGGIRSVQSEIIIKKINNFCDRRVVEGDDVCKTCILEAEYFYKKNPPIISHHSSRTNETSSVSEGNYVNDNNPQIHQTFVENNNNPDENNNYIDQFNFNSNFASKDSQFDKNLQDDPNSGSKQIQSRSKDLNKISKLNIDLLKASANHRKCIICFHVFESHKFSKYTKQKLIGLDARIEAFVETGVYIVEGSRCCLNHLDRESTNLTEQALLELRSVNETTCLKESECSDLINSLRDYAKNNSVFQKFKNPYTISDKLCKKTTGRSTEEFLIIYNSLTMNESKNRSKSQALAIYLFWLKTGMTQETIAAYFGADLKQIDISHINEQVRTHLEDFVNKNYGSRHLTREMLLDHNSAFVNKSFGTEKKQIVALLADATYFEIGKSKNHLMQRISFSVSKNYNLIKPMVVCLSNGYIVEIYGPYPANMNDAQILKNILETDTNIHSLLREGMKALYFKDLKKFSFSFLLFKVIIGY